MMTKLQMLAAVYGIELAAADGFELAAPTLRAALVLVLAAKRDELRAIVAKLDDKPGNRCPNIFRGELNAARFALRVIERDVAALLPRKVVDTTAELIAEVG